MRWLLGVSPRASASTRRVAVAASQSLAVADRVKIFGDASVSSGSASVGVEANTGHLDVRDQVTLRDRAHVLGSVLAKSVQRGNSVLIDGGVTLRPTPAAPVSIAWTVSVGSASLGPVQLEPDRTRDLPPGKYTTFSVKSRSSVTLHSADIKDLLIDIAHKGTDIAGKTSGRIAARRASDEGREGIAAFLDKCKPHWGL